MSKYKITDRATGKVHYVTAEELAGRQIHPSGGRVVVRNIKTRGRTRQGHEYPGEEMTGHHAEIVPRRYIRIYGLDTNRVHGPVEYDKTFSIGDIAIYGRYNLVYTGPIVAIGNNSVTIDAKGTGERRKRLTIAEFNRLNRHFDAESVSKHNREWMD